MQKQLHVVSSRGGGGGGRREGRREGRRKERRGRSEGGMSEEAGARRKEEGGRNSKWESTMARHQKPCYHTYYRHGGLTRDKYMPSNVQFLVSSIECQQDLVLDQYWCSAGCQIILKYQECQGGIAEGTQTASPL